jgi:hypothetical protein
MIRITHLKKRPLRPRHRLRHRQATLTNGGRAAIARHSEDDDDDSYRWPSWALADLEFVNGNGTFDAAMAHADDVGGDVAGLGAVVGHVNQSESQALV